MNVRDVKRQMILQCNATSMSVAEKEDLKGYGTIWYHPNGIPNILSLKKFKKRYSVTFGSVLEDGFVLH